MMNNIKKSGIGMLLVGIFLMIISVLLIVKNADFIFYGKTVDLDEILKNGGEIPQGSFVTYTCDQPLGSYGKEQELFIFIPVGKEGYYYAIFDENGTMLSAKISDEKIRNKIDNLGDGEKANIKITGRVRKLNNEMKMYYLDSLRMKTGFDRSDYYIDTTDTKTSQIVTSVITFLIGGLMVFLFIKMKKKR